MIKKYAGILIIFIMVLSGCTKDNPVENPINEFEGRSLINIPKSIEAEVGAVISASKIIDGCKSGSVIIDTQYQSSTGPMKIFAEIKFKANAFTGSKLVTMMIDNVSGTVSFDPPSVFSRPANLDMKLEGVDLSGINQDHVDFVYINPNGTFEPVLYKDIIINISSNNLEIKDAEINHFSRYGWCR